MYKNTYWVYIYWLSSWNYNIWNGQVVLLKCDLMIGKSVKSMRDASNTPDPLEDQEVDGVMRYLSKKWASKIGWKWQWTSKNWWQILWSISNLSCTKEANGMSVSDWFSYHTVWCHTQFTNTIVWKWSGNIMKRTECCYLSVF